MTNEHVKYKFNDKSYYTMKNDFGRKTVCQLIILKLDILTIYQYFVKMSCLFIDLPVSCKSAGKFIILIEVQIRSNSLRQLHSKGGKIKLFFGIYIENTRHTYENTKEITHACSVAKLSIQNAV